MSRLRLGLLSLLAAGLTSCGGTPDRPPLYPVTGQVLVDGRPARGAVVILHPAGAPTTAERPRGRSGADGVFALTTYEAGDGAPAGEFLITVEWRQADDHPEQGASLLPAAYADPKTSKLRTTVTPGSNAPLTLRLSRMP